MSTILLETGVIDAVTPDFRDFALRLHDLDAFNRLLGL